MIDERTNKDLSDLPILDDSQVYIYILKNSVGKIKIGKTRNIQQRVNSLGGSNGQGNKIIRCYCSPTYLDKTIENIMHAHFDSFRIKNTEWFIGIEFEDAINVLEQYMESDSYKRCNNLRKELWEKKLN